MTTVEERAQADMKTSTDALIAILPRVSAMNSFLRSSSGRGGLDSLHRIVYHYKREALVQATWYGIAEHRRAGIPAKCRDCGGTCKYTDYNGYTHDHCHRCSSTGYVRLEFVETTLPGAMWLTPRDKAWSILRYTTPYETLEETTNNPQINQPGADLTPSQVAEHLCEIEAFFPKRPEPYWHEYGQSDPYATYTIWIGATPADRCHLCAVPIEDRIYGGHVVRTGRVMWNARVCKTCDTKDAKIFLELSVRMPSEFVTPSIAEWIARHPAQPEMAISRVVESYPAMERPVADDEDGEIPF